MNRLRKRFSMAVSRARKLVMACWAKVIALFGRKPTKQPCCITSGDLYAMGYDEIAVAMLFFKGDYRDHKVQVGKLPEKSPDKKTQVSPDKSTEESPDKPTEKSPDDPSEEFPGRPSTGSPDDSSEESPDDSSGDSSSNSPDDSSEGAPD